MTSSNLNASNCAVVMIDMQPTYTKKLEKDNTLYSLISAQKDVLDVCISQKIPVAVLEFYNQTQTHSELKSKLEDCIYCSFTKKKMDGFSKRAFRKYLSIWEKDWLILMGVDTSQCVIATAKGGIKQNYKIATSKQIIADSSYGLPTHLDWNFLNQKCTLFENNKDLLNIIK
jgi:nicotinamidase-related amidase